MFYDSIAVDKLINDHATNQNHATLDYGSALWYWEFPQLKYWLNLLDFGIEKNFSFIIVD